VAVEDGGDERRRRPSPGRPGPGPAAGAAGLAVEGEELVSGRPVANGGAALDVRALRAAGVDVHVYREDGGGGAIWSQEAQLFALPWGTKEICTSK